MSHVTQVTLISSVTLIILSILLFSHVDPTTKAGILFLSLFYFRYIKLIVNTASWLLAKPYPYSPNPRYHPGDVTVIIPTANPGNTEFRGTVKSALLSGASKVIVVTFGEENTDTAQDVCEGLPHSDKLLILDNRIGNKRAQMCLGISKATTEFVVFMDDHVFWPEGFLRSILAPFENPAIGGVGTHKRVRREQHTFSEPNIVNFLGCIYLDRHNMEILATNRLDGGVFIISSRTAAYRTSILADPKFQHGFKNEYINTWFGPVGPLNADDDNFMMRWLVTHGHKIWIQNGPAALMETTINNPSNTFLGQLLRWVRTTWRSNPRSLWEGKVIHEQPWSLYATYISLFVNFALFWDPLLLCTLFQAVKAEPYCRSAMSLMALWIIASKLVKLTPHLSRNPSDILLLPGYFVFAYVHSLIKLWALFTFWNISWGSRSNVDEESEELIEDVCSSKDT